MYLAYHRKSKPTGELLGQVLQIPHGTEPESFSMGETLIRWGSRANSSWDNQFDQVVNSYRAIELCSNKFESLCAMDDYDCETLIKVPDFCRQAEELIERVGYPILGRNNHHARGTDIQLILQKRDLRRCNSDFFTQYIPTDREFRVHVVGSEVIRVQGKYLDFSGEAQPWVRNFATGYRFRQPRRRLRQDRLDMSVAAVKALGLDFGAVDLLLAEDGNCFVLEVNTAPSCSPLTLSAYAVALKKLANLPNEIDLSVMNMLDTSFEERDTEE